MSRVFGFRGWAVALASLTIGFAGLTAAATRNGDQPGGMAHMAGHMSHDRAPVSSQPGDQQKG